MTAGVSRLSFLELKNPAYCKYTKKEEKILENGVEIIGTIITDVDRNAEKIVLPKYVEGTLWNMSLCNCS